MPSHDRQTSQGAVVSLPPHVTPAAGDDRSDEGDGTDEEEDDEADTSTDEPVSCLVLYAFIHGSRGWLGSRVVSVLDTGADGPGFKSQS